MESNKLLVTISMLLNRAKIEESLEALTNIYTVHNELVFPKYTLDNPLIKAVLRTDRIRHAVKIITAASIGHEKYETAILNLACKTSRKSSCL